MAACRACAAASDAVPFRALRALECAKSCEIAPGPRQTGNKACRHWIGIGYKDTRHRPGLLQRGRCCAADSQDHIGLQPRPFRRESFRTFGTTHRPAVHEFDILSFNPAEYCKLVPERAEQCLIFQIVFGRRRQHSDAPGTFTLLRARREHPGAKLLPASMVYFGTLDYRQRRRHGSFVPRVELLRNSASLAEWFVSAAAYRRVRILAQQKPRDAQAIRDNSFDLRQANFGFQSHASVCNKESTCFFKHQRRGQGALAAAAVMPLKSAISAETPTGRI